MGMAVQRSELPCVTRQRTSLGYTASRRDSMDSLVYAVLPNENLRRVPNGAVGPLGFRPRGRIRSRHSTEKLSENGISSG